MKITPFTDKQDWLISNFYLIDFSLIIITIITRFQLVRYVHKKLADLNRLIWKPMSGGYMIDGSALFVVKIQRIFIHISG